MPGRGAQRRPGRPAARQRALLLPRLRGRRAAAAARRRRASSARPARPARPGWPSRRTCCSRWAPTTAAPAARCGSPSATPRPRPTSTRCSAALPAAVERARRARRRRRDRRGQAESVRSSRDEGAGGDVRRGRLGGRGRPRGRRRARRDRRAPGAGPQPADLPHRRARLLHAGGRPRRPPGRRRDRHPVLRLGHGRASSTTTWSTTSSPSTRPAARPTRACAATRRSSSPRCWTGRVALGFDAVVTGHHARLGADGLLRRSVDPAKDQSYVLAVLTRDQLDRVDVPARRLDQGRGAGRGGRARAGRGRQARLARHLLHRRRRHPRLPAPAGSARRPGDIVDADTGAVLGQHDGAYGFTVGQRAGLDLARPAADGRPRYVLSITPVTNTVTVGPAEALEVSTVTRRPSGVDGRPRRRAGRVRGAAARPRRDRCRRRSTVDGDALTRRAAPPGPRRRRRPGRGRVPARPGRRHRARLGHHRRADRTCLARRPPADQPS